MIRKLTIFTAFSMFCALSNAQNNMPSALDQLAIQCRQVIELNDTINARQNRLDELKGLLDDLKQNWLQTCNEVLSSTACDDNAIRINTINELIQLTDPQFEAGLLAQLKEARNNAEIRTLTPDGDSSSSSRQGGAGQRNSAKKDNTAQPRQTVQPDPKTTNDSSEADITKNDNEGKVVYNPVTEEQPTDDNSVKKDESATPTTSKDSKKENPEKQVQPEKKDKTKIKESKDHSNRNKTIELMNRKNKNQNK